MKRYRQWHVLLWLLLLALTLQSCASGSGNQSNFSTKGTTKNGTPINISDQVLFKGKIYLTFDRNLYVLDGKREHNLTQLTSNMNVSDPAVSPNGKQIAFIQTYKNYSDLMIMASSGGKPTVIRSGKGKFIPNSDPKLPPYNTYYWYAQPTWRDNTRLVFLSDLGKTYQSVGGGIDNFMLDMQAYQISLDAPDNKPQEIAYARYGDGGNRDPSFRPKRPQQFIYTHYQYDDTGMNQKIQIYLEDPDAIANNPGVYKTGAVEYTPAVALTPDTPNLQNLMPAFSPDGNAIAYIRRQDATNRGLYIMTPPVDDVTQNPNSPAAEKQALAPYNKSSLLLSGEYISQPVWSPDGGQIVYIGYTNNVFDLWLATITKDAKTGAYKVKGTPQQLTNAQGHLDAGSRPFWTQ